MDFGKILVNGAIAGLMVGVLAGLIIGVLDGVGIVTNLVMRGVAVCPCCCIAGTLSFLVGNTLNIIVWLVGGIASLGAGIYLANRIAKFSAAGDMLVGGAVGGLLSGIIVGICGSVVVSLFPLLEAAIEFIGAIFGYAQSQDFNTLLNNAVGTIVSNFGWILLNVVIFLAMGIFLGLIGGIIGSFIFKAAGKEE